MKHHIALMLLFLAFVSSHLGFAEEPNQPITPENVAQLHEIGVIGNADAMYSRPTFSADGTRLIAVSQQKIEVWELSSKTKLQTLSTDGLYISGLAISPDETRAAAGLCRELDSSNQCVSAELELWNLDSSSRSLVLLGHEAEIPAVAFSPDGTWLASGSFDQTVRIWNAATGDSLFVLGGDNIRVGIGGVSVAYGQEVTDVTFSPNGKWLAASNMHGDVYVWDAQALRASPSGTLSTTVHVLTPEVSSMIWDIDFTADSQSLMAVGSDGTVHLWDVATQKSVKDFSYPMPQAIEGEMNAARSVVAMTGCDTDSCDTGIVTVHAVDTQKLVKDFHTDSLYWSVKFNPAGTLLALTGRNGGIRLWGVGSPA